MHILLCYCISWTGKKKTSQTFILYYFESCKRSNGFFPHIHDDDYGTQKTLLFNKILWESHLMNTGFPHLLSGTNSRLMQKLGFSPRGKSSCHHRLLPHPGLEQRNGRTGAKLWSNSHTELSHPSWEEAPLQTTANHSSRADRHGAVSGENSDEKQEMSKSTSQKLHPTKCLKEQEKNCNWNCKKEQAGEQLRRETITNNTPFRLFTTPRKQACQIRDEVGVDFSLQNDFV